MVAPLIGYARVSTSAQAEDGVSLAAQRERIEAYCRALGLPLLRVEEDVASGSVAPSKRAGLARALAAVADGEASGVVVLKLDRLSRSVRDLFDLLADSQKRGWRLVSVSESLDTGSAMGRMVVGILAVIAQMEREVISERTKEGLAQVCREGRRRSGRIPFGYALGEDGRTLVPCEDEQHIVRSMLTLREGGRSPARIASWLNRSANGWNPRTNRPWTRSTVAAILRTHDRRAKIVGSSS